jgi:hypothetical protein
VISGCRKLENLVQVGATVDGFAHAVLQQWDHPARFSAAMCAKIAPRSARAP